jgi:hypothetical protein
MCGIAHGAHRALRLTRAARTDADAATRALDFELADDSDGARALTLVRPGSPA